MGNLNFKIQELEKEIEVLKRKIIEDQNHPIPENERNIAELLHNKLCHYDHTSGCGWYYDKGNWKERSRQKYLEKARKVLEVSDEETLNKIFKCIF